MVSPPANQHKKAKGQHLFDSAIPNIPYRCLGAKWPLLESGKSEIKTSDQLTRLDDGRLLNRCLSFPASDSSQSRKVTIFGRFAVALGQTIQ